MSSFRHLNQYQCFWWCFSEIVTKLNASMDFKPVFQQHFPVGSAGKTAKLFQNCDVQISSKFDVAFFVYHAIIRLSSVPFSRVFFVLLRFM